MLIHASADINKQRQSVVSSGGASVHLSTKLDLYVQGDTCSPGAQCPLNRWDTMGLIKDSK